MISSSSAIPMDRDFADSASSGGQGAAATDEAWPGQSICHPPWSHPENQTLESMKHQQADTAAEFDALLPAVLDKAFKGEL